MTPPSSLRQAPLLLHIHRTLEAAAGARKRRPVEPRLKRQAGIAGAIAEIAAVVESRRTHDPAGIVKAVAVKAILHFLEGTDEAPAEHHLVELGPDDSVAVL